MKPDAFIILTPGFPKNKSDSTCLPAQQLFVRILKEKYPGLQIIVIAFQYPFFIAEYGWNDCTVIALGGKGKGKIHRLMLWRRAWLRLKLFAKEKQIVGLLSFWCGECALIGKRFGRQYGIVHKCWILGQDAKKENHFVRKIRPEPTELIAMSDFLNDVFLTNHSVQPAFVITNGIDPRSFHDEKLLRDIDILGVGSLIPLKQFDVFIGVMVNLKKYFPSVRALICGKGPEKIVLEEMIIANGLQENIALVGELPHPEVLHLMSRSKLLLHCSVYEGFPTVCLEALAAGTSVIGFIQPMKQAISNWHIVEKSSAMAEKAIHILNNPETKFEDRIPYRMEECVQKIMQLFSN